MDDFDQERILEYHVDLNRMDLEAAWAYDRQKPEEIAGGSRIRRVFPAVAISPSSCNVSVPSDREPRCAMIADKKFGKFFKPIQSNRFCLKRTRKPG